MNGAINMLVEKINNILCIRFLNGRNMAYIKGLPSQLSCFYERKKILGQFYSSVASATTISVRVSIMYLLTSRNNVLLRTKVTVNMM